MALLDLLSLRNAGIALAALLLFVNFRTYFRIYKLKQHGSLAPRFKSWAPFGLEFPFRAIKSAKEHRNLQFWHEMRQESGATETDTFTFEFTVLGERIVFTADPDNVKALLTAQFQDYGKGPKFHQEWKEFLGDSIFNADGQKWNFARQMIRPMFMRERVADLDVIEEHIAKVLNLTGPGDGRLVSVDKIFSRFSLDASTHFLFGHSAGSLDDEQARFGLAFDEVQRVQALTVRAGPLRHFISQKTFKAGLRTMDEFMDPWINEVLALSPEELETKMAKSDTFIHALARNTRDRKVIRDQLVSLLLAGRDTTAATLSWLFLELARNPRVVQKIHDEIQSTVGSRTQRPTYENIKDMKYLTAVINETLRLYPAVPFNVRAANKDTTLPTGGGPDGRSPVAVAKGTFVGYSTLVMQRRRDLYPPISDAFPYDPAQWVPERWATWTPKNWNFIPFNGGPRICIGQQFAMVEMGYTIIRILQKYDTVKDYGNPVVLRSDILLTPAEGVKVGFVGPQAP